ncbi:MAG: sec-independent protein translocase protein TatC [Parcubacteria bacterium C7867-007]|nr:MAG: sec-independent protein translocase protein TatC [Parcubacteria bacterium C7867-007]
MEPRKSDEELSLWQHLAELRNYFFISLTALIIGAVVTHNFNKEIIELLFAPLGTQSLVFLSPLDPLLFIFKVDFFGGFLLSLPVIAFCAFRFIAPALGKRSNWHVIAFLMICTVLVLVASIYTYLLLLPLSIGFLLSIQVPGVENFFTADRYMDFALMQLTIMIGIFQIPCIIAALAYTRVLDPGVIARRRGLAYLVAIIALSILTPTSDLYTLGLFLVPTLLLFEISLIIGRAVYSIRTSGFKSYEQTTHT